MMTVLEQVRQLIERIAPKALCDDCIASRLKLTIRQHANHKTRKLAKEFAFERRRGACSSCGDTKLVIRTSV